MKDRKYNFKNLFNVRDLGGYEGENGKITKEYKYIRGTAAGTLEEKEKEELYQDGIRVIVDLRSELEVRSDGHPLVGYKDIVYYNIDLTGSFENMIKIRPERLEDMYINIVDNEKGKIKKVLKIFIENVDKGIFFNCTAGKDRTGIISMFLLHLAGVSEEEIVNNYKTSYENNLKKADYIRDEIPNMYFLSKSEYMEEFLRYFTAKYHDVPNFLSILGFSKAEIETLKKTII